MKCVPEQAFLNTEGCIRHHLTHSLVERLVDFPLVSQALLTLTP